MSKSLYNVVTPDEASENYGADALRVYEMFVAPFEETVQWSEEGIRGSAKFLARVYRLAAQWKELADGPSRIQTDNAAAERNLRRKTHQTIAKVADDLENFRFNTAVAALMEWVNQMYEVAHAIGSTHASPALDDALTTLILVLSPFAPHLADELWNEVLGNTGSIYRHAWPESDPDLAREDEITLVVQINGKVRDKMTAPADSTEETLRSLAAESPRLKELTEGKTIRKVIVVPGRLVNFVVT